MEEERRGIERLDMRFEKAVIVPIILWADLPQARQGSDGWLQ